MQHEELDSKRNPIIVGVGASAGGLRPLQELFGAINPDVNATFIVVQHLSEEFESVMDELLARTTSIQIDVAKHNMPLQPSHIYLNPPGFELTVRDGRFHLKPFPPKQLRMPINLLFNSLAQEYASESVAVVLSGTGSDGSEGIKQIQAMQGLTIAQTPESAQFDGMPKNALATGCIQSVLMPREIAQLIEKHATDRIVDLDDLEILDSDDPKSVSYIFTLLSSKYGIDFGLYKPTTVARRIDRRLLLTRHNDLRDYVDALQSDENELDLLYHDLLIGVTRFFRDPDAFKLLKQLIALDIRRMEPDQEYRIWSAGCATGEEAYSLAMMLYEIQKESGRDLNFKIFATDIHERTLAIAGAGLFEAEAIHELPASRKAFFQSQDGKYRIHPQIRSTIVFAKHDVISDPPFTRMNLVLCRNLLIYLQAETQKNAIAGFSFALNPGGLLMLGPSESLHQMASAFDCEDKEWRIFRRNRVSHRVFSTPPKNRKRSLPVKSRTFDSVKAQSIPEVAQEANWAEVIPQMFPSGIVIDQGTQILRIFGQATKYFPTEYRNRKISGYFDEKSRTILDSMLAKAASQPGVEVLVSDLTLLRPVVSECLNLSLRFVGRTARELQFGYVQIESDDSTVSETDEQHQTQDPETEALKNELFQTRENLSTTILQLESGNEELQAANEELVASNEELQATNEELQSVNEELHTVNLEHQRKVQELELVTNDFNALFDSSRFGSILLDKKLRIRKFTRNASKHFSLINQDIGRPLSDFASTLMVEDLSRHIGNVLETGNTVSQFANDKSNRFLLLEISPYLIGSDIEGVILNVIDVLNVLQVTDRDTQALLLNPSTILWQNFAVGEKQETSEIHFSMSPIVLEGTTGPVSFTFAELEEHLHPEEVPGSPFVKNSVSGISKEIIRIRSEANQYRKFEVVCNYWEGTEEIPSRLVGTLKLIAN